MAYTFQGIDPGTTGKTGLHAKQYLEGVFGQPLDTNQIGQAGQYLSSIGYTDQTGNAAMSGAQWNQLMQESANRTGGTFNAWQAAATPTAPTSPPLELGGGPAAPTFEAPTPEAPAPYQAPTPFQYEAYQAQTPFSYDTYRPTQQQDLYTDPSYLWRQGQTLKAMESSQAAKGLLRTGGAMIDLGDRAGKMASEEFGNVDARRRADYQLGYGTEADIYDRNASGKRADYQLGYGTARDIDSVNRGEGRYANEQAMDRWQRLSDTGFRDATAEYAPRLLDWQSQREDRNRAAELNFDRDWQQTIYDRDDTFRRSEADRNERYRNRTYDADSAFRTWLANLQNTQFVAELGTRN